jgi:methylmalonyl-CoA/ethylmalonyl-CoA epimerase
MPDMDVRGTLLGVDHIGIAVDNLSEAIERFQRLLGGPPESTEEVEEYGVKTAFFGVGETNLELLEPLAQQSPIAKFLQKRGPGVHHVCLSVSNLEGLLQALKSAGVRLIDETPRKGAHGKRVAFVHPNALCGVLLELSEQMPHSEDPPR